MLDGATVIAPTGAVVGVVAGAETRPPVAGVAATPVASWASIRQLAAIPGAIVAPAAERPFQAQDTVGPVPVWLAIVAPEASSTRAVQESDPDRVALKRTG